MSDLFVFALLGRCPGAIGVVLRRRCEVILAHGCWEETSTMIEELFTEVREGGDCPWLRLSIGAEKTTEHSRAGIVVRRCPLV